MSKPASRTVAVSLGPRSYTIEIGAGTLAGVADFLQARRKTSHVVIVTDENVETTHGNQVAEYLDGADIAVDLVVVEPGEETKSVDVANQIWQKMLEVEADRKSIVMAIGGGVVGDLAGFVAASYARGIGFVQIPTTLLAQVDSSVGGKVGVNLPRAKNMVGAFWQPLGVLIDTDVLATLGDREYRCGLAEVVKYGVILDADFFAELEANKAGLVNRHADTLERVIARSCELKAQVVTQDEREETGLRAVLNYGHTFAHAIEAIAGYGQFQHGEAVSIGMICASLLAERLGRIDSETTRRQFELLRHLGLPVQLPALDHDRLIQAMRHDKKVEHGKLRFVLPSKLGHVELVGDVDVAHVRAVLKDASA
ncbi:MAG: 3-dehydroquinate synthase [Planctomycetes bacterium]|nr:3-dehydroquinate synthase [Planctomycetota bacterium]